MNGNQAITQAAFDSSYGLAIPGAVIGAGQMQPQAAEAFLNLVVDQSNLRRISRRIFMTSRQSTISAYDITKRPLKPGVSGTSPGITAQLGVSDIVINTHESVAVGKINDDELEDNARRGDLTDFFLTLLAAQIGNQIEEAALIGNTLNLGATPPVDIRQQVDGWVTRALRDCPHRVDGAMLADGAAGANTPYITQKKLSAVNKALPRKWKSALSRHMYFVGPDLYQDFYDLVADRPTPRGDIAYTPTGYELPTPPGGVSGALGYAGKPLYEVPLMPDELFTVKSGGATTTLAADAVAGATSATLTSATGMDVGDAILLGVAGNAIAEYRTITAKAGAVVSWAAAEPLLYTHATGVAATEGTANRQIILLTEPNNLIIAFVRDVRIEPTRWGPDRATYVTVSLRWDTQVANTDNMSYVDNVQTAA